MMSRRVSLLTLKGIFLMTIAVGIISSSFPWTGVVGALICDVGGEPPVEEKSELSLGESDRLSGEVGLSNHCFETPSVQRLKMARGRKKTHRRQPAPHCLVLEGRLVQSERVILGLGGDWR